MNMKPFWAVLIGTSVALGLAGLILFASRSRLTLFSSWAALAFSVFALLYRAEDSYLYLVPVFLSFAIWLGWGLAGCIQGMAGRFPGAGSVAGLGSVEPVMLR